MWLTALIVCFAEPEKVVSNSKSYISDSRGGSNNLENYFFDLECQMEGNKICRDMVCTDAASEKGGWHKVSAKH